jgi:endonuclease-3 related protein
MHHFIPRVKEDWMLNEIGKNLLYIYNKLYEHHGLRHWWPAQTPWEVVVGAVLTQFVAWKNVEQAIKGLKREGILTIEGIYSVDMETLEQIIKPTRFYKQKAVKLKNVTGLIMEQYGGKLENLFNLEINELRNVLLDIKGIGPETADSIMLYAAQKPVFVIDAYTLRIFSRLGILSEKCSYGQAQSYFMDNLPADVNLFNEYHAQIDGLGHRTCLAKRPKCSECPLEDICPKTVLEV